MDWEAHRAHLLSVPSRGGLAAMARAVAPGSRPVRVRRLGGGLATATHAVDLRTRNGSVFRTVLKRYAPDDDTAPQEWDRLHCASAVEVP
ncbi:MAG TPA: hypothetical protein VNE62_08310, partial [Actinomycetota bacterium]|nr:hypothetical protein [Actinomycetota bacterium]